jgi:hypothetical protein
MVNLFYKIVIKEWFYSFVICIKHLLKTTLALELPVEQHRYPVAGLFGAG